MIKLLFNFLAKPDRYLDPGSGSILVQLIIAALGINGLRKVKVVKKTRHKS
jgi:hypothetical protein